MPTEQIHIIVDEDGTGRRMDQFCAAQLKDYSRERIKQWINDGVLRLNDAVVKPKNKVQEADVVSGTVHFEDELEDQPEAMLLDIRYEDEHLLILNKPIGLVVHPAAGNRTGTLVNGLLHYFPESRQLPRAGIVHRLDKDTSGVMMVAKSIPAHTALVAQLQAREIKREYQAVVAALLPAGRSIDAPIGRHNRDRLKMAIVSDGKPAVTHYTVADKYRGFSLLDLQLETGRTHQIRVHMASIHAPIVGDQTYGRPSRFPKDMIEATRQVIREFPRQALHAKTLTLHHPITDEMVSVTTDLPEDMQALCEALRQDRDALS